MYCDYYEHTFTEAEIREGLAKYLAYCTREKLEPEVRAFEEIDGTNLQHVMYHAVEIMQYAPPSLKQHA